MATTRELVVLDFETTGLTPAYDRTIEVAATLLVNHRPVETFHQLMHPRMRLPPFITSLTGITDAMLRGQPRPEQVMRRLQQFVRGLPIVAHNAAFDRGFLHAELARAGLRAESEFLCTMRLARRLASGLPSYRLDALVDALQVRPRDARQFHRSLGRREPHGRHLAEPARALHRAHRPGHTARRRVEHPDAQAEEAGAKVPGVAEGREVLSLADKRGGLRLIILNGAHRANVLQLGDFNEWRGSRP